MSNKIMFEKIQEFFNEEGYFVLDNCGDGAENKRNVQDKDGYKFFMSWHQYYGGRNNALKKCMDYNPEAFSIQNPYTIENIILWLKLNSKPFDFDHGNFEGNNKYSLFFKCHRCNNIWDALWAVIEFGGGCPYCSGKRISYENSLAKARPDLIKEWDYAKNGELTPYNVGPRSGKKVWWKCSVCSKEWKAEISNRNGKTKETSTNCPKCCRSSGELEIERILSVYLIKYFSEYGFEECKYKKTLFFDFYLPEKNCCIEFNGRQHYDYNAFWKKYVKLPENNFEEQLIRDKIKENFCIQKGILFIKIPYWDFNKIEEILINQLRLVENNKILGGIFTNDQYGINSQ